jgi:hypothetical protein
MQIRDAEYVELENIKKRTSRRNKLQVMRHRRVVNKCVCDHLVCFLLIEEDLKDSSGRRKVQLHVRVDPVMRNTELNGLMAKGVWR